MWGCLLAPRILGFVLIHNHQPSRPKVIRFRISVLMDSGVELFAGVRNVLRCDAGSVWFLFRFYRERQQTTLYRPLSIRFRKTCIFSHDFMDISRFNLCVNYIGIHSEHVWYHHNIIIIRINHDQANDQIPRFSCQIFTYVNFNLSACVPKTGMGIMGSDNKQHRCLQHRQQAAELLPLMLRFW